MNLSNVAISGIEIFRDGSFATLGTLAERKERMLAVIQDIDDFNIIKESGFLTSVVTTTEIARAIPSKLGVCVSDDPFDAFIRIHEYLGSKTDFYGVEVANQISAHAQIHSTAIIGEHSIRIASGCVVGPKAVVLERSSLGTNVSIGPGTIVGCGSFVAPKVGNNIRHMPCMGGTNVENSVQIHSNCTICRSIFGGTTSIGEYTMLDNLVSIGQNAKIGRRCLIPASAVIGPNVLIGDDVWIGPNAVVAENLSIGDEAYVTLGSVVVDNVAKGAKVTGNFAVNHDKFISFMRKIR